MFTVSLLLIQVWQLVILDQLGEFLEAEILEGSSVERVLSQQWLVDGTHLDGLLTVLTDGGLRAEHHPHGAEVWGLLLITEMADVEVVELFCEALIVAFLVDDH